MSELLTFYVVLTMLLIIAILDTETLLGIVLACMISLLFFPEHYAHLINIIEEAIAVETPTEVPTEVPMEPKESSDD